MAQGWIGQAGLRIAAVAAVLTLLALGTGRAQADELVMPYQCLARGGDVRLIPAEDISYRILGARDRQIFSACSPTNPNRCRNWMVHRFDIQCGGARVAWIKIVEAANRQRRLRTWVEGGRMHLEMGPMWTVERDMGFQRPGASRGPSFDGAGPHGDTDVVTLPPGFAPMLGLNATFVADGVADAGRDDEMAEASPGPPQPGPQPKALPPAKPVEKAPAVEPRVEAKPKASSPETSPPQPTPVPRPVEAAPSPAASPTPSPAASPTPSPTASPTPSAPPSPAQIGNAQQPTILNAPKAASPPAAAAVPPKVETVPTVTAEVGKPASVAEPKPKESAGQTIPNVGLADGSRSAPTSFASSPWMWAAAIAAAALVSFGFFSMLWRREETVVPERDLANVSLTGTAVAVRPEVETAVAVSAQPMTASTSAMPSTLSDALALIGANPEASIEAIKKVVDGLRQNWHPDLARSDEDRALRLQRMQSINAAWAIIEAQHRAA